MVPLLGDEILDIIETGETAKVNGLRELQYLNPVDVVTLVRRTILQEEEMPEDLREALAEGDPLAEIYMQRHP